METIAKHMLCKLCRIRKIGRLQLLWCNDCASHIDMEDPE